MSWRRRTSPRDKYVIPARAPRGDVPGQWLVLLPASAKHPGALANTSDGLATKNNCRFSYRKGLPYATLITTRRIAADEELLVAYGPSFSRRLHKAATVAAAAAAAAAAAKPKRLAVVECPACHKSMRYKALLKHRGVACAASRKA